MDVHVVTNFDPVDIAAQYGVKPDGAAIADDGVADDSCVLCEKAIFTYLRSKSAYRNDECHNYRAAMIAQKSAALSDAPPIKPPSTSGLAKSSAAFLALQLPP